MKKRIFLCIIICLSFSAIGVAALSLCNAKDIEYMADEEKYSNRKKNQILSKTEGRQREHDISPEDNAKTRSSAYEIEVKVEDEKPTIRRFTVK